jgi:hypothetical protein
MRRAFGWIPILLVAVAFATGRVEAASAAEPELRAETKGKPRLDDKDTKRLWAFKESVALGVPEDELAELVAACRAQGMASAEIQRLLGLIAKAKLAGLPHEDLLLKLKEGLAKGASPELIDAALAGKAQTLRRAKTLVDNLLMEGYAAEDYNLAIKMVADALDAGLSPQQVLTMVRGGQQLQPPPGTPDPGKVFRLAVPRE